MQRPGSHVSDASSGVRLPVRSRWGGALMLVAGPIVVGVPLLALTWWITQLANDLRILLIGLAVTALAVAKIIDTGRRMRVPDGWELMRRDPRPPVVYLRSFIEDRRITSKAVLGSREGGVDPSPVTRERASREPHLARALRPLGPFVAVGAPGERLAPIGAARIYVSDETWQDTVASLVRDAGAVVLQPEATPGTWWELQVVARTVDLRRVLLLVPNPSKRPFGYHRVCVLTAEVLPVPLPEQPGSCDAFMFDDARQPQPLTFGRRPGEALRPFLAQVARLSRGAEVTP